MIYKFDLFNLILSLTLHIKQALTISPKFSKFSLIFKILIVYLLIQFKSDQFGRIYTDVLAIDAIYFQYPEKQFEESKVMREITKCYSGFKIYSNEKSSVLDQGKFPAISTGNWGCGAFRGDRQLKCKN